MKVAIVHDYLNQFGGAERCVAAMLEAFPSADLYASFYVPEDTFDAFRRIKVHTSFMQHIPGIRRHYRKYFMLYPCVSVFPKVATWVIYEIEICSRYTVNGLVQVQL